MSVLLDEIGAREYLNQLIIEKSMGRYQTPEEELGFLEKAMGGRGAQMGEVRTWGGKEYVKTPKGWRPKPKGFKEKTSEKDESKGNKLDGGAKELELFNKDGDQLNVRVYKDGGVKVEGMNVREDFDNTTQAWNFLLKHGYTQSEKRSDKNEGKFEDKGGGKFELKIPGKGGAQISEGDGKFEVKVWDKDYKYLTDDSKRHVFDSKSEAENFARILLGKKQG